MVTRNLKTYEHGRIYNRQFENVRQLFKYKFDRSLVGSHTNRVVNEQRNYHLDFTDLSVIYAPIRAAAFQI